MENGKDSKSDMTKTEQPAVNAVPARDQGNVPKKKAYRISPPAEMLKDMDRLRKWRPERLTIRQGIAETPLPILIGYVILIVASIAFYISSYLRLPELVEVMQWFGLSTAMYNKTIFLVVAFCIQIFFIYRDLIRRSLSRNLFLVPFLYFCLAIFIISSL